jgi:hypothetical protein
MVEKASNYEYLVTYMDDILIRSKDLMAVIKSLEKNYMVKSVGTLEYCSGGNVEFFGESWKNQGFGSKYNGMHKYSVLFYSVYIL